MAEDGVNALHLVDGAQFKHLLFHSSRAPRTNAESGGLPIDESGFYLWCDVTSSDCPIHVIKDESISDGGSERSFPISRVACSPCIKSCPRPIMADVARRKVTCTLSTILIDMIVARRNVCTKKHLFDSCISHVLFDII